TLGILIALRFVAPMLSAVGSVGAIIMGLITLSFLLTTPGVWQPDYGFPFLSSVPGQFLVSGSTASAIKWAIAEGASSGSR
ncbi:MAG: DUF417 family protein, partial [Chthoniobacterales bacterium]|nr:DUF417 family protein [Chthoniobacterales bacterium]